MDAPPLVIGVATRQLAEMAEAAGFDGIGIYAEQVFVHVDIRGYPARWESKEIRLELLVSFKINKNNASLSTRKCKPMARLI